MDYWLLIDGSGQDIVKGYDAEDAIQKNWTESIIAIIKLDKDLILNKQNLPWLSSDSIED